MAAWLKSKAAEVAQVAAEAAEVAHKHANDLQQGVSSALVAPGGQGSDATDLLSNDVSTLQAELISARKEVFEANQHAAAVQRNLEVMKNKTRAMFQRVKEDSHRQVEELQAKLQEAEQRVHEDAGEARHSVAKEVHADFSHVVEDELEKARGELAAQREAYTEKAEALQEKAKGMVQNARSQRDEKVESLLAELETAVQESEERLARTESDAHARLEEQLSQQKDGYRQEMLEFQERTRGVVKKLREQSEERIEACTQEVQEARTEVERLREESWEERQDTRAVPETEAVSAVVAALEAELESLRKSELTNLEQAGNTIKREEEAREVAIAAMDEVQRTNEELVAQTGELGRQSKTAADEVATAKAAAEANDEQLKHALVTQEQLAKAEALHAAENERVLGELAQFHKQAVEEGEAGTRASANTPSFPEERMAEERACLEAALLEQRQVAEEQLNHAREQVCAHREEVRELGKAHHKATMDRHTEAEARLKDAVERERHKAEEQAEQSRTEFAAQQTAWRQEVNTLREKARSLMTRVKEQSEERISSLASEVREARAEADRATRQFHDQRSAAEDGAKEAADSRKALEDNLSQTQAALGTALDKARRAERDLEASFAENRELLACDRRAQSLQQQLDRIRGENFANQKKGDEIVSDLSTQCADLQLAIARRDEDCRVLQSELQESRITVSELEAKVSVFERELAVARMELRQAQERRGEEAQSRAKDAETIESARGRAELATREAASADARAVATEAELERLRQQQAQALASVRDRCDSELQTARRLHEQELASLRDAQAAEVKRLQEDMLGLRSSADSHKTLDYAVQERLAKQGEQAAQRLDEMGRELHEVMPKSKPSSAEKGGFLLPFVEDVPLLPTDAERVGDAVDDLELAPATIGAVCDDLLGPEQASAWRARAEMLESRCKALQRKLDARPVIYQVPPVGGGGTGAADDIQLEPAAFWERSGVRRRSAWELWLRDAAGPLARRMNLPQGWEQKLGDIVHLAWQFLVGSIDDALRSFTKRLLRHDKFLWVFYAHLLLLYMIAASSFASTATAPDPLGGGEVSIQEAAQVAVRHREP